MRTRDDVTMAHAADALEIDRWLDIEGHTGLEGVGGFRVDTRQRIAIRRCEADPMAGCMFEGRTEAVTGEYGSRRRIHAFCRHAGPIALKAA